jgi:hypothetical protein
MENLIVVDELTFSWRNYVHHQTPQVLGTTRILGFSNVPSWVIGLFKPMDMSILTKGSRHVFFKQPTWLEWLIYLIHLVKLNNPNQNDEWVLVKWNI